VFCGNKVDLESERVVKEEDLQELASKYKAKAFLTSAKTGQNVENAFKELALGISEKMR